MGEQGINKTNQTYRGIAANKPKLARPPVNGGAPPPTRQAALQSRTKSFFPRREIVWELAIDAIAIVRTVTLEKKAKGEDGVQPAAMEMDLSGQAGLLISGARGMKTAEMELGQSEWSRGYGAAQAGC